MSDSTEYPRTWKLLVGEWRRSLKAQNKADSTIRIYTTAVRGLARWMLEQGYDIPLGDVRRRHIEGFIIDVIENTSEGNAHTQYRSLRTFFGWLVEEEEIGTSPMAKTKAPYVPEKQIPIVPDDLTKRVLEGCKGRDLVSRRDAALIRLLLDTGCRLSEVASLTLDDLDLDMDVIHVVGKGRRSRAVPFGSRTAQALSRYLRVRQTDRWSESPQLWLADRGRGPLRANGVKLMLRRRGRAAGLPEGTNLHAHQFRHTLAHTWRKEGGDGTDLMRIMGWRSSEMLHRYGASAADDRAHANHRRMRLGDRL